MPYATGNSTYDTGAIAAESTRQVAVAAASTQAAATTATKTYLTTIIALAAANGIFVPNEQSALNAINTTGNP